MDPMKKKISLVLALVLAAVLSAGCSSEISSGGTAAGNSSGEHSADESSELSLIVASNQTSPDNPYSYGMDQFKEVVEDISDGKIQVTVHKGTLGENESELVEKLRMGDVDMIVASPAFMCEVGVPELDFFSLEYLFDGFDHWETCLDGEFGDAMKDIVLEKTDNEFRVMGYWSSSVRDVYARKPILGPDDLKNLTIRGQSSNVQQEFWNACGAMLLNVSWGDLYQALEQGIVDGAENDYTNLMQKEHHKTENGRYISETHHDYTTRLWLMDGNYYNSLTDEQKAWIEEASDAATRAEREVTFRMFEKSRQKCIDDGAIITENADIDIAAFKALAIPIQDEFAQENGLTEELKMIRDAE